MRLAGGRQLRDVAAFEGGRQLAAAIDGLPAPKRLKLAAAGAVPAAQLALATLPAAALSGPLTPATAAGAASNPATDAQQQLRLPKAAVRVDPWLLLTGGATGVADGGQFRQGGGQGVGAAPPAPQWLQGAVRVRKTDLPFCFVDHA